MAARGEETKFLQDDAPALLGREVNEKIQPKICKVMSPYAEGTGYIIDDEEGII